MDSIDRLKLAIYESGLSGEDQEALLEYVEEAVIDKDYLKTFGDVVPKYLTAVGGVSTIANSGKFNSINKKIKENKTRLKVLCDKLKKKKMIRESRNSWSIRSMLFRAISQVLKLSWKLQRRHLVVPQLRLVLVLQELELKLHLIRGS